MFFLIPLLIWIEHSIKKDLKKDFEEILGLQPNDDIVERIFEWF